MTPASDAVFDGMDEPVSVLRLNGTYSYINDAGLALLHRTREEVLGRAYLELYPDLATQPFHEAFARLASGSSAVERVQSPHDPMGLGSSHRLLRVGELIVVFGSHPAASRSGEHSLREMIEGLPQLAWWARADGFIEYYNPRWYAYTGTTPADMAGWGWRSVHDPALLPDVEARWRKSIASGEAFEMEFPLRRHDGVFRWFLTRVEPTRDETGAVTRWVGVNTDIDDQRTAAQRALAFLYTMIEQAPATMAVVTGDDLVFEVANQRYLELVGRKSLVGQPMMQAMPELAGHGFDDQLRAVMRTGRAYVGEEVLVPIRRDGVVEDTWWSYIYARLSVSGDEQGQRVFVLGHEITDQVLARREQSAARETAESASKAKDEFIAMLAHEMRGPLAPIRTALDLMRLRGDETLRRERRVIENQVDHMVRLVDDLLDVAGIAQGKIQLRLEPIEVAVVAVRAMEIAAPVMEQRKHTVVVQVPPSGLEVDGDPARLAQILANLLTNAGKYTNPGGRIVLSAVRVDQTVAISVEDNGLGIERELLDRVFDLFTQARDGSERAAGGLGLGLTIVRSLARLHGGDVTAHSDGPGKGSRFTVRLPLTARAQWAVGETLPPLLRRPLPQVTPRRVLLVDDNVDAAEMLAELITSMGHEARVAHDPLAALAIAATFAPEIALLDIGLPIMDGYELGRRLRSDRPLALVALTGYGQEADLARSAASGFDAHLVKPVALDLLTAILEKTG